MFFQSRSRSGRIVSGIAPSLFIAGVVMLVTSITLTNAPAQNATAQNATAQNATAQNAPRVLDVTKFRLQAATQTPTRTRQNNPRLAALEADMIARVNATRRSLKLSTLRLDPLLAEVARAHSLEMRDKQYFAHESPTNGLVHPIDRYRAGFRDTPAIVAENIYRAWSTARTVPSPNDIARAHNALLKSPGHRKNIVEPRVSNIGVGIVQNANGDIWITQMFSRPTW